MWVLDESLKVLNTQIDENLSYFAYVIARNYFVVACSFRLAYLLNYLFNYYLITYLFTLIS